MDKGKALKHILDEAELVSSFIEFFSDHFEIRMSSGLAYTIKNPPTERCYELAIKKGYNKEKLEIIKKLQQEENNQAFNSVAVKKSGLFLKYIKYQTPKVCIEALKENRNGFYHVKIVKFKDFEDCLKKLQNKLKLENLIKS